MAGKAWSQEELQFLKENIDKLTTGQIAKELGRSRYAVYLKARQLGIYMPQIRKNKKEDQA